MQQRSLWIALCIVVVAGISHAATPAQTSYDGAYIAQVEGELQLQRATEPAPELGEVNLPVLAGDRVWTEQDAYAVIRFADATELRLGPKTKIDFIAFGAQPSLRLWNGSAVLRSSPGAPATRIDTPTGSFVPQSEGEFRLDVVEGLDTTLTVNSGIGELASEQGSVLVHAGERSHVAPGEHPVAPFSSSSAQLDALDQYGAESSGFPRQRSVPLAAVPAEVEPYVDELDEHGTWREDAEHGSVWYPSVSASWGPYRDGRWSYTRYGHTWVSHERWGWAPYHYGRWGYNHYGWYWIPGGHFSPAWVSFAIGPSWVGWSPLGFHGGAVFGYGSFYYGHRYNSSPYYRSRRYGHYPRKSHRLGKAVPRHVYENGAGWNFQDNQGFGKRGRRRLRAGDVRASAPSATVRNEGVVLNRDLAPRRGRATGARSGLAELRQPHAAPFDEGRIKRTSIRRGAGSLGVQGAARGGSRRTTNSGVADAARARGRRVTGTSPLRTPTARSGATRARARGTTQGIESLASSRNRGRQATTTPRVRRGSGSRASGAERGTPRTRSNDPTTGARTRRFGASPPPAAGARATTTRAPRTRGRQGVSRRAPVTRAPATRAPVTRGRSTNRPSRGRAVRSNGQRTSSRPSPRATPSRGSTSRARSGSATSVRRPGVSRSPSGRTGGASRGARSTRGRGRPRN